MKIIDGIRARLNAHLRGWKTTQKIVVIESDDWGSIRTSSPEAYKRLKADGYAMERSQYCLDALETEADIESLFDLLSSIRDCRGRAACITANMVMANPDFQKIRDSNFDHYFFEPVSSSLKNYENRKNVSNLWAKGFDNKFFIPQLHAREHVRYWEWLSSLKAGSAEALLTFHLGMCGLPLKVSKERQSFYLPIYIDEVTLRRNEVDLEQIITEGKKLFEQIFGFRPLSTVAPNITWTPAAEKVWAKNGIRYIQGGRVQYLPMQPGVASKFHYLGEQNNTGCIYHVRNCIFEPSKSTSSDYWCWTLKKVKQAFTFREPAIISTHRVNYIGSIRKSNREWGCAQLRNLMKMIVKNWPDVRFLSTPELGHMIENNFQNVDELSSLKSDLFPRLNTRP